MSKEKNTLTAEQVSVRNSVKKKKTKKIIKTIIITVIILLLCLFGLRKLGILGNENTALEKNMTTYEVGTRSITQVLTSSGTIEPNDQYTINALVSGEIIGDYFEEGDTVVEDQLLYSFDSDNLNSGVTRAQNSLKNANNSLNDALENLEKLDIESDYSGTVKKMHVELGDKINAGTLIADIVDNETMCMDIPFMDVDCANIKVGQEAIITFDTYEEQVGVVTEISPVKQINALGVSIRNITVSIKNTGSITPSTRAYAQIGDAFCTSDAAFYNNDEGQVFSEVAGEVTKIYYDEGDTVYDGNIIVRLESDDLNEQIDKLKDAVTEAEDSLDDANDAFDNYNIEAPITGKVISKNYKTGDTLSGGQNSSSTLAVIYDMSALKFTMSIDELDIDKLDKGQDVVITCDSREGEEYHGTITNISIQGTTTSGTTVYPVEVTIENVEDIDKRTISDDGTINKVYKTGMTSTEKTYSLSYIEQQEDATVYVYSDEIRITRKEDGSIYDGEKQLKKYLGGTYSQGSSFYNFSNDFSSLTLEIQNDKKMLRPGMNIDAEIIVEKRENVIAVPLSAVGRGNIVKVLVDNSGEKNDNPQVQEGINTEGFPTKNADTSELHKNNENNLTPIHGKSNSYGSVSSEAEYEEIRVTVGISDDDYVEITSGLDVGDIVVVDTSNLGLQNQNIQFGMMGAGMPGGIDGRAMMGGGMPAGGMGGGPMGR